MSKKIENSVIEEMVNAVLSELPNKWGSYSDFHEFLQEGVEENDRLELIYSEGGEGEGEHAESVFKLDGVFYKADYNYYSYNGFDYDYMVVHEVIPTEKTVIVYE